MKEIKLKQIYPYFILFAGAIIVLLLSPLSPLSRVISTGDSNVYVYCAQQILDGKIMYKEVFDHKGPLLYLINAFGLIIGNGNTIGVWFLEIVSLFTSLLFIYKSIRLFYDKFIALISSLSSLILFMLTSGGNIPDEYAICFISIAMYYFFKIFRKDSIKQKHYFIISLCFACVLLLKPNLVIMWGVGWLLYLILLIKEQKWTVLKSFVIFSFIGVVVVLIPFFFYFSITDSITDFKFCYWDFNRAYSDFSIKSMLVRISKRAYLYPIYRYCNVHIFLFSFLIVAVINFKYFQNKRLIIFVASTLLLSIIGVSLGQYLLVFYYLIFVPILSFVFATIYHFIRKNISYHSKMVCFVLFLFLNSLSFSVGSTLIKGNLTPNIARENLVSFVKENTDAKDEITVFGNSCWIYSLSERKSASKYAYTHPIIFINKCGDKMFKDYYSDIEIKKPKLIILDLDRMPLDDFPQLITFIQSNYLKYEGTFDAHDCWIRK